MRRVCAELAWIKRIFHDLQVSDIQPIPLKCDSLAAIHIAKNPVYHERTKHVEIDCHYVHKKLQGLIQLSHVSTNNQLVDVLLSLYRGQNIKKLFTICSFAPSRLKGVLELINGNLVN